MDIPLQDLQRFVKNCDPGVPLTAGHPFYCALDEGVPVRGSVGQSCIDDLYNTIVLDDGGTTRQLFTGFSGSGKTTELRRLERRLNESTDQPTRVVYVDAEREYVNTFAPIEPADLIRIVAYVLDREALLAEGRDPDTRHGYAQRILDLMRQTQPELTALSGDRVGARLMAELKTDGPLRRAFSEGASLRFQAFAQEAAEVAEDAVLRIKAALGVERVVLIVDGLEKMSAGREEDRPRVEASVENTFVEKVDYIPRACHLILTFPMWLRYRAPRMGSYYSAEPSVLPMVKIKDPGGAPYQPGLDKLATLVGLRIDVARVFGDTQQRSETLGALLLASGGYPRDLLRMLREVLRRAGGVFPVQKPVVDQVITRLSEEYRLGLRDAHFALFEEISRTHVFPRGDDGRVNLFGQLLDRWYLLAYRNGVPDVPEWYDLHPLVARTKVVREVLAAGR